MNGLNISVNGLSFFSTIVDKKGEYLKKQLLGASKNQHFGGNPLLAPPLPTIKRGFIICILLVYKLVQEILEMNVCNQK